MKTSIKNIARRTGLIAVDLIAAPLHITAELAAVVSQATADGIAMGEGYITEKIDPTKERNEVATNRVEYTKAKFIATAMAAQSLKDGIDSSIQKAKDMVTKPKAEPEYTAPAGWRIKELKPVQTQS